MDDKINYFERKNNKFVRKTIRDVDYQSILNFYYSGKDEIHEITYEKLLVGIGLLYIKEEIPSFEDLEEYFTPCSSRFKVNLFSSISFVFTLVSIAVISLSALMVYVTSWPLSPIAERAAEGEV